MKTKCEPGDIIRFPDNSEWVFVTYLDDGSAVISEQAGEDPQLHSVPESSAATLHWLIVDLYKEDNP